MNKLKEYRTKQKLSQQAVADKIGIGIRIYQYYEADQKEPAVRTAIRIARALGTTVEELFVLEDEEQQPKA